MSLILLVMFIANGIALAVEFETPAKSAILMDTKSGQILWEKNPHEKLPPASMTKIMSLLLAMEAVENKKVSLDDLVSVSAYAESMGGSQIFLSVKDRLPLETMLKAITIASANDACVAVAEFLGGTEENFVDQMNEKAKELGMKNTHFMNTTGLPHPDHYSTAYDIALMGRELIKYEQFREWAKIWTDKVQLADGVRGMSNTNSLINTYQGLDGIKTGHTEEAGYCLAASAERTGFRLVSVVMNTKSQQERNQATAALLDFGFRSFTQRVLVEENEPVENVGIQGGKKPTVSAYTAGSIKKLMIRGEDADFRREVKSINKKAPVKQGDKVGELTIYQGEKEIGKVDLLSNEDIAKTNIFVRIFRAIGDFFKNIFGRIF